MWILEQLVALSVLAGAYGGNPVRCERAKCECMRAPAPAVALARAAMVVEATVVAVLDSSPQHPAGGHYSIRSVVLVVHNRWKGPSPDRVVLHSRLSDCEFPFVAGRRYLVYAFAGADGLETSICTRTRLAGDAAADFVALGPPLRSPGRSRPRP